VSPASRSTARSAGRAAAALAAGALPGIAAACPSCNRNDTAWSFALLGVFILLPWGVGLVAYRALRRGEEGFRP
jgi:hypothetical protein